MSDRVLLGIIDLVEAKRIRASLGEMGVKLEMISNPDTCSSGGSCKPTVELYASEPDLPKVAEFFRFEKERDQGGIEVNPELLGQVFDSEKASAVCPACGT